jgi:hypothetical protein
MIVEEISARMVRRKVNSFLDGEISHEHLGLWAQNIRNGYDRNAKYLDLDKLPYIEILHTLSRYLHDFSWGEVTMEDAQHISDVLGGLCDDTFCFSFKVPVDKVYQDFKMCEKFRELRKHVPEAEKVKEIMARLAKGEAIRDDDVIFLSSLKLPSNSSKNALDLIWYQISSIIVQRVHPQRFEEDEKDGEDEDEALDRDSFSLTSGWSRHFPIRSGDEQERQMFERQICDSIRRLSNCYLGLDYFSVISSFVSGKPYITIMP